MKINFKLVSNMSIQSAKQKWSAFFSSTEFQSELVYEQSWKLSEYFCRQGYYDDPYSKNYSNPCYWMGGFEEDYEEDENLTELDKHHASNHWNNEFGGCGVYLDKNGVLQKLVHKYEPSPYKSAFDKGFM